VSIKSSAKVSVLILTFNNGNTIERCLNSVLEQDLKLISEIIVWDNKSDDSTTSKIEKFMENCPIPLKLEKNLVNHYLNGSGFVLDAIKLCNSEFIAILDGDDEWILSTKTQLQVDTLMSHQSVNVVSTRAECFDVKANVISGIKPESKYTGLQDVNNLARENFIFNSSVLFRKSIVGKIPDDYRHMPIKDYPMWVWGSMNTHVMVLEDISTRYNHNHGGNVSEIKSTLDRLLDVALTKISIARRLVREYDRAHWLKETSGDLNYYLQVNSPLDEAVHQRDEAVHQRDEAVHQRDEAVHQRDEAVHQRDQLLKSRFIRLYIRLKILK
jgi:glycosyltransferase involved in cell wall biosynthesis